MPLVKNATFKGKICLLKHLEYHSKFLANASNPNWWRVLLTNVKNFKRIVKKNLANRSFKRYIRLKCSVLRLCVVQYCDVKQQITRTHGTVPPSRIDKIVENKKVMKNDDTKARTKNHEIATPPHKVGGLSNRCSTYCPLLLLAQLSDLWQRHISVKKWSKGYL